MVPQINPSLSVDCVVFGFDGRSLKVLLIERRSPLRNEEEEPDFKLPGSLIFEHETVDEAAHRVLKQYTDRQGIYLCQLHVFSEPDRIKGEELEWLQAHYRVTTSRVVTVAYYMLVKLDDALQTDVRTRGARWIDLEAIQGAPPNLAHLPEGCPFAPRCRFACEVCRRERPKLLEVAPGHLARCHRPDVTEGFQGLIQLPGDARRKEDPDHA